MPTVPATRPSHALLGTAIAVFLLAATVAATTAQAATTTANACRYSYNNEFRQQSVSLGGHGSPRTATAGTTVTLSGGWLSATLPPSLPKAGYDLGIFRKGANKIPSRVWLAINAANTTDPIRVVPLTIDASTKIAVAGTGAFRSGTPIKVTIPIPDQTWTATGSGPVTFSQARAGSLPPLPVGLSDKVVATAGSVVVAPRLGSLRFVLDCEPGTTAAPYTSLSPAVASPFATLDSAAPVAAIVPGGKVALSSKKLKVSGGRLSLPLTCTRAAGSCVGTVSVTSSGKTLVRSTRYSATADGRKTVRLKVSGAARSGAKLKVSFTPDAGKKASTSASIR